MGQVVGNSPLVGSANAVAPLKRTSNHDEKNEKHRLVDVAKFRIMPGAGAPQVSAQVDSTLGTTGLLPFILNKIQSLGSIGGLISNGIRFATRLIGPSMYTFSAIWNARLLPKALKDPTLGKGAKATLCLGEVGTIFGAFTAILSALPQRIASFLRLGLSRQVLANKFSGISGGVAGIGFAAINLVETMHRKDAKPAERFFAKTGFVIGLLGFIAGTTALALSMGMVPGLAPILPIASKIATFAGIGGVVSMVGQLFLGKNKLLNDHLKGTVLG